jgi:hypothetical protein
VIFIGIPPNCIAAGSQPSPDDASEEINTDGGNKTGVGDFANERAVPVNCFDRMTGACTTGYVNWNNTIVFWTWRPQAGVFPRQDSIVQS